MILRVDSEVKKPGVETGLETRYFVASLEADEASPKRLMDSGSWPLGGRERTAFHQGSLVG